MAGPAERKIISHCKLCTLTHICKVPLPLSPMQTQRAFTRALELNLLRAPTQRPDAGESERVSKAQRFYRGLGAVGGVMGVALADWLGRVRVLVRRLLGMVSAGMGVA